MNALTQASLVRCYGAMESGTAEPRVGDETERILATLTEIFFYYIDTQ